MVCALWHLQLHEYYAAPHSPVRMCCSLRFTLRVCLPAPLLCTLCCCRQPGITASERPLTVREILTAHQSGQLLEVFGSGTACLVQPVGCVVMTGGHELSLPAAAAATAGGGSGSSSVGVSEWGPHGAASVAEWARKTLTDIQYGLVPGHPWSVPFE